MTTTSTTVVRPVTTAGSAVRLTNPLDIRATCDRFAREYMGRRLTDAEAAVAARIYQDSERQVQQPGATVAAPGLEAFCATWVSERFPDEIAARNMSTRMRELLDFLTRSPLDPPRATSTTSTTVLTRCRKLDVATGRYEYQPKSRYSLCPLGWDAVA